MIQKIEENGGTIWSDRAEGALKYRAPTVPSARSSRRALSQKGQEPAIADCSCRDQSERSGDGDEIL